MKVTLNIGLARNDGRDDNSAGDTLSVLFAGGWLDKVYQLRIATSETERTLVIQCEAGGGPLGFGLYPVADSLAQDCIAVRNDDTGEGALLGPQAAKWGEFNPDYFLEAV